MRLRFFLSIFIFFSLAFLLYGVNKVYAADPSDIFSSSYIFDSNMLANVTYREEFTNTSNTTVIDKYRVIIPFIDAKDTLIRVNGVRVDPKYKKVGNVIEADVSFSPVSLNQKVIVVTTFSTSIAISDYGGMKVINIPSVDPKAQIAGQKIILPSSFGKVSSNSADCMESYENNVNIICNSGNKIYLTVGNEIFLNFRLNQSLKNSSEKSISTEFLFPYEDSRQSLYFYPNPSDFYFKKDNAENIYLNVILKSGEEQSLLFEGLLGVNYDNKNINNDTKDLLKETDIWDISSQKVLSISKNISDGNKVENIYKYIIDNYSPSADSSFERSKVSDFIDKKELSDTQYADLAVTLLRANGIKSRTVIGYNNGLSKMFSAWTEYFDTQTEEWRSFDTFFSDKNYFGDRLFFNTDRLIYFVIDGYEDKRLYESFFVENNSNYLDFPNYEINRNLIKEDFDVSVKTFSPEKVALNTNIPISLRLINNSSRLVHLENIKRKDKTIKIRSQDENIWVFPGQNYNYNLDGVSLTGLFNVINTTLKFDYSIVSGNQKIDGSQLLNINATPTLISFLPIIYVLLGIVAISFIFVKLKDKIRKGKNNK